MLWMKLWDLQVEVLKMLPNMLQVFKVTVFTVTDPGVHSKICHKVDRCPCASRFSINTVFELFSILSLKFNQILNTALLSIARFSRLESFCIVTEC